MGRTSLWVLLPLAALVSTAALAAGGERLASPAVPGFVAGYAAANDEQSIREEVPRGETVQAWTRMITTQRFTGVAARVSPAAYVATIRVQLDQSCPGASASPILRLTIGGHAAARFRADCPDSGGQPESFLLLAIAGRSDMHVKQAAVRGATTPASLTWGERLLAATVLCEPADRRAVCR